MYITIDMIPIHIFPTPEYWSTIALREEGASVGKAYGTEVKVPVRVMLLGPELM